MKEMKAELKKLRQELEDADKFYDLEKYGSMLRKVHESKSRIEHLIEKIETK